MWVCRCDCGNMAKVITAALNNKSTRSCGCLQKDAARESARKAHELIATHRLSGTLIYRVWHGMMTRCYNEDSGSYHRYGKRGIRVCRRWHNVVNFFTDMGHPPAKGYSIDRIDNDGDYKPSNCRWTAASTQARNRRSNVLITYNGKTQCLKDWATELGLPFKELWKRVRRDGWGFEKAVTTPFEKRKVSPDVTLNGQTKPLGVWCKELGIAYTTALARYQAGKKPEEILRGK